MTCLKYLVFFESELENKIKWIFADPIRVQCAIWLFTKFGGKGCINAAFTAVASLWISEQMQLELCLCQAADYNNCKFEAYWKH